MLQHNAVGGALLGAATMTKVVPIFVAAMVLLIRVLLINTFSLAGERIFTLADQRPSRYQGQPTFRTTNLESLRTPNQSIPRPAPRPVPAATARPLYNEPTYHPVGMSAQEYGDNSSVRR
jgi:hypothetical protein